MLFELFLGFFEEFVMDHEVHCKQSVTALNAILNFNRLRIGNRACGHTLFFFFERSENDFYIMSWKEEEARGFFLF